EAKNEADMIAIRDEVLALIRS
ncbi:MAG: hypothetical protein RL545_940, partial [Actinomycetota bacterium]